VLLIPLAWAVVATSAATQLGVREDFGLAIAAIAVVALRVWDRLAPRARPLAHAGR
jgi:hypothetical protein